jgi:DNA-binding NarL/FixJ family response regulator
VSEPGYSKGAQANRAAAMRRDKGILARLESGWSYADIAKELNVSMRSVRQIVYRARRRAGIPPTEQWWQGETRKRSDLCLRDHRLTPENTYTYATGQRVCKRCKRENRKRD